MELCICFFKKFLTPVLVCVVAVTVVITSEGQIVQTRRYEQVQKSSDEMFSIISLNEQGLALVRSKNKYDEGKQKWDVILLDTAFQEKFSFDILVKERYPLVGYEFVGDSHLYLLFRTGETNRNSLELIDLSISEGRELARYEIKPELDFKITHFNKAGQSMVLGGYVNNDPTVLLYNMAENQIKVVPGFFQKDNELVELRVNQNQTFNVVIIDRSSRSERKLIFKTFDDTGKLLLEDIVPIGEDRTLQTAISSSLHREELLILGTWGERQGKQSNGYFALSVDPFSEQKINYLSFGQLNHFTDYMNQKRADRIKESALEAATNGKIPSFSTYVMPFRLEEHKSGYLMLSEVYQPSTPANSYYNNPYGPYSYNPYSYSPFWPGYYPGMRMYRPYSYGNNVRNTDEIKIYASVLTAFDPSGQLKWDYSFKLDELKKLSLEQASDYYYDGMNVYFFYKKESEIRYKVIDDDEGMVKEGVEKVLTKYPEDEIRSDRNYEDGIRHWTGNTFYVWGYQTLRNVNHSDDRIRDVFFITKLVVE
jgi:hypothetical protein